MSVTIRTRGRFSRSLTKALEAGSLTWHEAELAEARLDRGQQPAKSTLDKIAQFAKSIPEDAEEAAPAPAPRRTASRAAAMSGQQSGQIAGMDQEVFWRKARTALTKGLLELRDLSILEDRLAQGGSVPPALAAIVKDQRLGD